MFCIIETSLAMLSVVLCFLYVVSMVMHSLDGSLPTDFYTYEYDSCKLQIEMECSVVDLFEINESRQDNVGMYTHVSLYITIFMYKIPYKICIILSTFILPGTT